MSLSLVSTGMQFWMMLAVVFQTLLQRLGMTPS